MPTISRRCFCIAAAHAVTGLLVCPSFICCAPRPKEFLLSFFHTHTEECLEILHTPGQCLSVIQQEVNSFLRDFRTDEVRPIDPCLLDILCEIQSTTGSRGTIEIISGYRSPQTNAQLSRTSRGVATHSLHMNGQALDIRIRDLSTRKLRTAATALRSGGVGYYASSDFVHLDTGRFRTW
jgi:uncharacterized protein YcbK (DUF882 family)